MGAGTSEANNGLEVLCRSVYTETAAFYREIQATLGRNAFGYKILYSPPHHRPPILFIGYQPGGSAVDALEGEELGERDGWPSVSEYAVASWPLAVQLRRMFGSDLVSRSVGLNAIFLRAPSNKDYIRSTGQDKVRVFSFCRERVEAMVRAMEPERIVVLGLATLRLFSATRPDLISPSGRTLTELGSIAHQSAMSILHPSGAQQSTTDRTAIASHVLHAGRNIRS